MQQIKLKVLVLLTIFVGTSYAQELHTHSNAASIANEANSVSGWGGSATESSVSTEAYSGTYSIKIESPNDGWNYTAYSFATTANEQYVISFYAKSASSTNPALYWGGGGVVENQKINITSTTWTQYTKTVTANGSTINMNIYPGTPALTGESVYIDHFSIMPVSATDTQNPTAPSLTSTGQSQTTVDLSWSGATDNVGVTGYNVYQDGVAVTSNTASTSYQATGLTASTAYSFKVRALDAAGNESVDSNVVSITTDSSTDTQVPTAPSLTSGSNTDTTVDLSWSGATDNIGVTGYNVYKDGVLEASPGNVITYQVTGLTASTAYNFTVTALDAAGNESTSSNQVPVTTSAASGGGGSSSVWSENSGVASYNGGVAIGTTSVPTGYTLAVEGKIRTREVRVDQDTWPDYVFAEGYTLPTLEEIQKYIHEKGHLPNIPSAKEVEANGVELGEMNKLLLEKIEELTLYILQQDERIKELEKNIR